MKRCTALVLIALVASCRLDTFFRGSGGGAPPVPGPPADLRFVDQPQSARARNTLAPVRVAVRDDQGNIVTGFAGLVSLALDSNHAGSSLGDTTAVAAASGVATFRHLRVDRAGTGYRLVASAPGTGLAAVRSQPFDILAPSTGGLSVTTTTTGTDLPSGYTVTVDDTIAQPIGINAVVTFVGLAAGSHVVRLAGVTSSCAVRGANPDTVRVPGGETAQASFDVTCAAPPPLTGNVVVTTATSGASLPSGYTATLDGGAATPIGVNDSITATGINPGDHSVALGGVPGNCTVAGPNPQTVTVTAGSTARAAFTIGCTAATGSLTVTTTTTGSNLPAGYTVSLENGQSGTVGSNASVTATGIPTGDHTVTLGGVPGNCTVVSPNPLAVTVTAGATTQASFTISCGP
jgi:hypothetical protein